jgi:hypothetical protein
MFGMLGGDSRCPDIDMSNDLHLFGWRIDYGETPIAVLTYVSADHPFFYFRIEPLSGRSVDSIFELDPGSLIYVNLKTLDSKNGIHIVLAQFDGNMVAWRDFSPFTGSITVNLLKQIMNISLWLFRALWGWCKGDR